jgi:bacillithiol synthase
MLSRALRATGRGRGSTDAAAPDVVCRVPSRHPAVSPRTFLDAYRGSDLGDLFAVPAGDIAAAEARAATVDRAGLAAALRAEHERWGAGAATRASLDKLAHPDSRVVATGQQIAWLLGPTYALTKTVTAIRLAQRLDRPERPVVPVFWMATQDHDVAEMDHAFVLGRDERLHRIAAPIPTGPAVGRVRLEHAWIDETVAALHALDGGGPHVADVERLLRDATDGVERWSDGFARLLLALLGDQGLLVVDPLAPEVARRWRPLLERELDEPVATALAVNRGGERLHALGWPPQLVRAEGATNLFVEPPGGGPRTLLRHDGGALSLDGRRVEAATLRAFLDDDPSSVTPAAGLRPVLQDALLPTIAFVVGPGELRYVAQLREVYEAHDVAMPLIWPRASATVLQPPVRRILDRHGLSWRTVMADPGGVECSLQLALHGHADAFAHALASIERDVGRLLANVDSIDPTLVGAVHRGRHHLEHTVLLLREKAGAALARRDADTRRQFERLRAHLLPNGGAQERVLSPFTFFLTLGVGSVLEAFLALPDEGDHAIAF